MVTNMTLEEFRKNMDEWWVQNDAREVAQKNSQGALVALMSLYESLDPSERELADRVIVDWVESDNSRKRFDSLAMIDHFRISFAAGALRRLETKLLGRDDHEAPYELAKVRRILARIAGQ